MSCIKISNKFYKFYLNKVSSRGVRKQDISGTMAGRI